VHTPPASSPHVAVVVKGWPRLSETFIARELIELERRGLRLSVWSLRFPTDRKTHPMIADFRAPVAYLPEYLWRQPLRVWRGWRAARALPGYRAARRQWLRDWRRDPTPNRGRRWGQALVLAAELPRDVTHLHAHFLHTPASVARYAAMLRGLRWSVSAHAKDIWTTPDWEKREKLADTAFCVTCTAFGCQHLSALAPDRARVRLLYHGLEPTAFPDPGERADQRDGSDRDRAVRLLIVGRAVPKKGLDTLLQALALLPSELHWRLTHIGGGDLRRTLQAQAAALRIAERIDWRGAQPSDAVLAAYRDADLFVLPSRVARDGDRDGLPNVLMEAASQRLALVSTRVAAIPELIEDGMSGILVEPDNPEALATALATLIADPARRTRLGDEAAARVQAQFAFARCIDTLMQRFAAIGIAP
jgi:glycosyltransferase involved in cell wall biosynthesis